MDHVGVDLTDATKVDKFNLDEELVRQAELYERAGEVAADAEYNENLAENAYKVYKAELDIRIRQKPFEFGLDKVTDTAVKAYVEQNMQVQELYNTYLLAMQHAKKCNATAWALSHKKTALENLVSLHLRAYYSEPTIKERGESEEDRNWRIQNEGLNKS